MPSGLSREARYCTKSSATRAIFRHAPSTTTSLSCDKNSKGNLQIPCTSSRFVGQATSSWRSHVRSLLESTPGESFPSAGCSIGWCQFDKSVVDGVRFRVQCAGYLNLLTGKLLYACLVL